MNKKALKDAIKADDKKLEAEKLTNKLWEPKLATTCVYNVDKTGSFKFTYGKSGSPTLGNIIRNNEKT